MKRGELVGIVPIVQTPFTESGGLSLDDLQSETEWLLEENVAGVGFGYGSEIRRMTDHEIDRAVELVVNTVAGKVPVVAPVASGSAAAMVRRASRMADLGADAVLAPPPHQASTAEGVVTAFEQLASSVDMPIVFQDAPIQTGVVMPVDAIVEIAQLESVIALKLEAPPTVPKIEAVVSKVPFDLPVFGGAGGQDFLYELMSGAQGTMPGASLPGPFIQILHAHENGEVDEARRVFAAILPLIAMSRRSSDTMCYTHKEVMRRRGTIEISALRSPSAVLPDSVDRDIDHALRIATDSLGVLIDG